MDGNENLLFAVILSVKFPPRHFTGFMGNSIKFSFFNFPGISFDIKNGKLKSNKNHTMLNNTEKQYKGICDALILNEY